MRGIGLGRTVDEATAVSRMVCAAIFGRRCLVPPVERARLAGTICGPGFGGCVLKPENRTGIGPHLERPRVAEGERFQSCKSAMSGGLIMKLD